MGDALSEDRGLGEGLVDMDLVVVAGDVGVAAYQLVVDKLVIKKFVADDEIMRRSRRDLGRRNCYGDIHGWFPVCVENAGSLPRVIG
jgi:hypothetical protein